MKKLFCVSVWCIFFALRLGADPRQLYDEGRRLQEQGNWYEAVESYKTALIENPAYNAVYQSLAECFYELDEYDQALDYVDKALRFRSQSIELQNLKGFILIGLKDLPAAQSIFNAVLTVAPNDVDARFGLAEIEVSHGKLISATKLYEAALARQGENRKALLSLALMSFENGNTAAVKSYINQALKYHGENPAVHYFAAYLSALENDNATAEKRLQVASQLAPQSDKVKSLSATVLYAQGKYTEALKLSDQRISGDRNRTDAWYLKTLCNLKLKNYTEAMQSAKVGLSINPNNEIMRSLLESIVIDNLNYEDNYRKQLAEFHEKKARTFSSMNNIKQAVYEYRQALRVYPYNIDCRFEYAKLLLRQGYYERYLEQLQFIQSLTKSNTKVNDAVEAYGKVLSTSLQNSWGIDPLYLDKGHIKLVLMYQQNTANVLHPESEKIATEMTAEIFQYNRRFTVRYDNSSSFTYAQAFKKARSEKSDYFGILKMNETEREIKLSLDLYVTRTGNLAKSFTVFRSGNDRYATALLRLSDMIANSMPFVAKVVKRNMTALLIDLGKNDGNFSDMEFTIVEAGKLNYAKEGIGLVFDKDAVLGAFIPGRSEEDLTEGTLKRSGYYDRVNEKDWCVATVKNETKTETDFINTGNQLPLLLQQLEEIRKSL